MFFKINFFINIALILLSIIMVGFLVATGSDFETAQFGFLMVYPIIWFYQFLLAPITSLVTKAYKKANYYIVYLFLTPIFIVCGILISFLSLIMPLAFIYAFIFIADRLYILSMILFLISLIQPVLDYKYF